MSNDGISQLTWWEEEWQDMPEFISEDIQPYQKIVVRFETKAARSPKIPPP